MKQREEALLVCLSVQPGKSDTDKGFDALMEIENIFRDILEVERIGYVDGHEFMTSPDEETITFFLYGPNADMLYEVVEPIFHLLPKLPGSYVLKQYGSKNKKEQMIEL